MTKRHAKIELLGEAEEVRALRKSLGLSQKDASLLIGAYRNFWSSVEKAEKPIPKCALELFAMKTGQQCNEIRGRKINLPSDEEIEAYKSRPVVVPDESMNLVERLRLLVDYLGLSRKDAAKYAAQSGDRFEGMLLGSVPVSIPSIELLCQKFKIEDPEKWSTKKVYYYDKENSSITEKVKKYGQKQSQESKIMLESGLEDA